MDRKQHLQWCKDRALEYIASGELDNALASMLSDLGKHPDTAQSLVSCAPLAMMLKMNGNLSTAREMREFIEGFN